MSATGKHKQVHGLKRVAFNRKAKELRADDNLPALKVLAVGQVFPMPGKGHPAAELWQVLATAATVVAVQWWENGGKLPHDRVRKAIGAAGRHYRARGGHSVDVMWRGGYDSHRRKYGSQQHDHVAAITLADAMDGADAATEVPETTEADERDQRDAQRERLAEHEAEFRLEKAREDSGDAAIATGAAMLEAGAERADHDGGHADDVRLDPRDDGERGYGVDGATRGLHTGNLVLSPYLIAWNMALDERSGKDRAFLLAIDKAGGFENYVSKDVNRKSARAVLEADRNKLETEVRGRALTILEAAGNVGVQAAWLAGQPPDRGYRTVGAPGKYRGEAVTPPPKPVGDTSSRRPGVTGVVVSAAWPKEDPTGARGKHWSPETVWRDYWHQITVSGHAWGDMRRNVKGWHRSRAGSPAVLSLLDTVGAGVKVQTLHVTPAWPGRVLNLPECNRSLFDDV